MANLMMPDADPEFKAYLKEKAKKEATTDYHSLKADFEDWKKHRKPKKAYLGTLYQEVQVDLIRHIESIIKVC